MSNSLPRCTCALYEGYGISKDGKECPVHPPSGGSEDGPARNMAPIFDRYTSDSERSMREALRTVDSVGPCVTYIDEREPRKRSQFGG